VEAVAPSLLKVDPWLKVGEEPKKRPQINDNEVGGSRMSRPKSGIFLAKYFPGSFKLQVCFR